MSKEILFNSRRIHFIGIGGIGMSGLAEYYLRHGVKISGSDLELSAATERLSKLGVEIKFSHSKNNVPHDTDIVVYTSAVSDENDEYVEAKSRGIKLLKRSQILGLTVNKKKLIAVAGSHGKTTTTAMIGKVLIDLGFDPTVFVGGNVDFLDGASSRIGDGEFAVVEADEYDRSFLTLKPDVAVVTNIEFDHSDIYFEKSDLLSAFNDFTSNIKTGGVLIGCTDDSLTFGLIRNNADYNKYSYGMTDTVDFKISDYTATAAGTEFRINGETVKLKVPGLHNVYNATGAYAALKNSTSLSVTDFAQSIINYTGVQRRLQLKYSNSLKVYDDYAHHPTEVSASYEAIKNVAKGRVITVFQPHLYSRTKDFYREFAHALSKSDDVYLMEIYPARELPLEGITSELIANEMNAKFGKAPKCFLNNEDLKKELSKNIKNGDVVMFQGAGDITFVCDEFISQLKGESK